MRKDFAMLKGVIFDMDGVLVNSEPMHYEAFKRMLEEVNLSDLSYEYFMPFIGSTNATIYEALRQDYGISWSDACMDEKLHHYNRVIIEEQGYQRIAGVEELVKDLKQYGFKLAVASSSPVESIEDVTTSLGIKPYFEYLVSGETVANPKPAPDVFLKAAQKMGLEPSECLVIEDSCNGVKAAKAAGIPCIGFLNSDSGKQDLREAAMLVEGFEEVDTSFIVEVYRRAVGEPKKIAETSRLFIREITLDDLDALYALYEHPDITKYIENLYEDRKQEEAFLKAYIKNMYGFYGYGMWVVIEKETNRMIGRVGLNNREMDGEMELELGYMIGVPYQKKGYAYEACKAVLSYMINHMKRTVVYCISASDNKASTSLAKKLGFQEKSPVTIGDKAYACFRWEG